MTALWPLSRIPQFAADGNPLVGAQAWFYNVGTTTPQPTYSDSALSQQSPHNGAGAVVADANGRFPAIYLSATPGTYRQRVLDADNNVIFDDDGISVPQGADFVPPSAGSTDPTLLFSTGDILAKHGTGAKSGWVRAAGRTIGSASSGASERANADTSALFQYLWAADSTLTVSSGRGGTAAGDFAANKTIALPDFRGRALVGLADMGNSASTLLSGVTVDNSETVTTLGATLGEGLHVLSTGELAVHAHTQGSLAAADHGHPFETAGSGVTNSNTNGGMMLAASGAASQPAHTGAPGTTLGQQIGGSGALAVTGTTDAAGSGTGHNTVQPSALVTIYVKL